MTELHFVGYNGYNQFPINDKNQPNVINKWTSAVVDGNIISCCHRTVLLETDKFLKIYGVLRNNSKTFYEIEKPGKCVSFGSSDEFLIGSEKAAVWKFSYEELNWRKLPLTFDCEEEKSLWENTEENVSKFSFQQNHTAAVLLLINGIVWSLSVKNNYLKLLYPSDVDKAIDICSGLEHSLILTESGCVLSVGNGSRGQLGHGDLNEISQPVQIEALEGLKTIKVAAGGWHSCAVTDSGDLYTWGWNNFGQLSAFENEKEIGLTALPALVDLGEESDVKVLDVACGRRHSIAVLDNGGLYSTGWNKYRQLGIESPREKVSKFTKCTLQIGENVKVTCGPWYTILVNNSNGMLKNPNN